MSIFFNLKNMAKNILHKAVESHFYFFCFILKYEILKDSFVILDSFLFQILPPSIIFFILSFSFIHSEIYENKS